MAKSNHFGPLAAAAGVLVAVALLMLMLVLVNSQPAAGAALPGTNGRIAYASVPWDFGDDREIYTIHPTGGTSFWDIEKEVTNNNTSDSSPSYSPNGNEIAYQHFDGHDWEIFTIPKTNGGPPSPWAWWRPFNVTNNTTDDFSPSYSPNGNKIAYKGYDGHDWEIFTIDATGGTPFNVTNNTTNDLSPSYSPNGNKIAYSGYKTDTGGQHDWEIFTIDATGGTPFNVTNNKQTTWDFEPSYSPNGNKIAYRGFETDTGDNDIFTIDATGGTPFSVTNNDTTSDAQPSWGRMEVCSPCP